SSRPGRPPSGLAASSTASPTSRLARYGDRARLARRAGAVLRCVRRRLPRRRVHRPGATGGPHRTPRHERGVSGGIVTEPLIGRTVRLDPTTLADAPALLSAAGSEDTFRWFTRPPTPFNDSGMREHVRFLMDAHDI